MAKELRLGTIGECITHPAAKATYSVLSNPMLPLRNPKKYFRTIGNSLDTCLEDRTAQDGSYAAIRALGANLKDYAPIFDTLSWLQAKERPAGAITCSAARQNGIVGVLSTFLGKKRSIYFL